MTPTPVNRHENIVGTDNETGSLPAAIAAKDAPQQHLQQAAEHYACASEHHQGAARYHESGDDKAAAYQQKAEAYQVKVAQEHAAFASGQEIDVSKESATLLKEMTANQHGASTTPKHESTCACRFPHSIPPPQAGEGENESLRDFHGNAIP